MGASKRPGLPAGLEKVQQRFARWRHTRAAGTRIPEVLWAAAVKVANRHGIHRVARMLRLDYYSLRDRVEPSNAARSTRRRSPGPRGGPRCPVRSTPTLPAFLELPPPPVVGPGECVLELEDAAGAKMRVHLKGLTTPDLVSLSRSFWNPAS
mgnify:CR=1 FL=1